MANKNKVPPKLYRTFIDQWEGCNCELCWSPTAIQPHHIVYKSESPFMVLVASNIIPLCFKCHEIAHKDKYKFYDAVDNARGKNYVENLKILSRRLMNRRPKQVEIFQEFGKRE